MRPTLTSDQLRELNAALERHRRAMMDYLDSFDANGGHDEIAGSAAFEAELDLVAVMRRHGVGSLDELAPQCDSAELLSAPF